MSKAIFLDRDGVINKDFGYVSKIENFVFIDGVIKALNIFQNMGYLLIIITNQSGIARGYFTEKEYEKLTSEYIEILKKNQIHISRCYFCPHHPDFSKPPLNYCACRKPNKGMFVEAIKDFNIDVKTSIAVGDKIRDLQPANDLGIFKKYLISSSYIKRKDDIITESFGSLFECALAISQFKNNLNKYE